MSSKTKKPIIKKSIDKKLDTEDVADDIEDLEDADDVSDTELPAEDAADEYNSDYEQGAVPIKKVKVEDVSDDEEATVEVKEEKKKQQQQRLINPLIKLGDSDDEEEGPIEWDETENIEIAEQIGQNERTLKFVPANERLTSERLTRAECAELIGQRWRHIDNGAPPYIDITNMTSTQEIAYNEFLQKKIPMGIIRTIGMGWVERWYLHECVLPRLPPVETFLSM